MKPATVFECVCKHQYSADPYHADYREIHSTNKNKAKAKYAKLAGVKYCDVLVKVKRGYPQW